MDAASKAFALKRLRERVNQLLGLAQNPSDRSTLHKSDFRLGSSQNLLNYAMILRVAKRLDPKSVNAVPALGNLHYPLGRNTLGKCFVSDFWGDPVMHPRHRLSIAAGVLHPVPGMVAGGPNADLSDPVAQAQLSDRPIKLVGLI